MAFNIRTRITVAIGVGVGLLAASITVSLYQYVQIARSTQAIETVAEEIELASRLQLAMSVAMMPANDYLITGRAGERGKFNRLTGEVEKLLGRIGGHFILNEEERALLDRIREGHERLNAMGEEILALSDP
ncbi:MAG TPA: hypothetical protein VN494_01330, partial [Patescibacteria group bacterium]|nr:hypothetical protein [Patescibacteria group bacterium]